MRIERNETSIKYNMAGAADGQNTKIGHGLLLVKDATGHGAGDICGARVVYEH